jgi:hypothetical protein
VAVYAVVAALDALRFESAVLLAHRASANARASDCRSAVCQKLSPRNQIL